MNIIVAGVGKIGLTLARQLSAEENDITVIDSSRGALEDCIERYDVLGVYGNCSVKDTLVRAGVKDAELLIAVTGSDEINLLCCMTARFINKNIRTIARIRNPEFADQIYEMKDAFALFMTVNPEKMAADEIEHLIKFPGFLKLDSFAKGRAEIVELKIERDSKLCAVRLSNINTIIKCKVLVCAVLRDGRAVMPYGDFILTEGDRIFVTAPSENLALLLSSLGIITHKAKKVMLCGGGRISYYLTEMLHNKDGISATVIDNNTERCVQLANLLPYANIIRGDASSRSLLESENISEFDAMVALTGMDELNVMIALYGANYEVPQVITKLGKMDNNSIHDILPIGSTVSPRELCCNMIVRVVRSMKYKTGAATSVHFIADGKAEAIEFQVTEETRHCGEPLKNIRLNKNILVCCITHRRSIEIPDGNSSFKPGDTVIIATNVENTVYKLNDIFDD